MPKQVTETTVTPKVRISGSMHQWSIDWINEEAKKEDRSFSDMLERLATDALKIRRSHQHPMMLTFSLLNDYVRILDLTGQPKTQNIMLDEKRLKYIKSDIEGKLVGGMQFKLAETSKTKFEFSLQMHGFTFLFFKQ